MNGLYSLQLVTAPTEDALDLAAVKRHLKVESDQTEDDDLIQFIIKAVIERTEQVCNRALVTQTWKLFLDAFPCGKSNGFDTFNPIVMPKAPLQSVTHVKYYDGDGALQTLASSEYTVDTTRAPGRIVPAYGKVWPSMRYQPRAVEVQFVCGYGAAKLVPYGIRQAMLMLCGHLYANRELTITGNISDVPKSYDWLLYSERIMNV